jgi:hypothetical protein
MYLASSRFASRCSSEYKALNSALAAMVLLRSATPVNEEIVGPTEHTSYPRNASSHSKGARDGTMAKAAKREALTLTWVSSYSIL